MFRFGELQKFKHITRNIENLVLARR